MEAKKMVDAEAAESEKLRLVKHHERELYRAATGNDGGGAAADGAAAAPADALCFTAGDEKRVRTLIKPKEEGGCGVDPNAAWSQVKQLTATCHAHSAPQAYTWHL